MADNESLTASLPKIVEALGRVLREEGRQALSGLLSEAELVVRETSYDNWNGGTYGYALEVRVTAAAFARLGSDVSAIENELLRRIAQFTRVYPNEEVESVVILPTLATEPESAERRQPPATFWRDGYLRLFISHVSKDKVAAASLSEDLRHYGISGFVAHEDIEPTKEWEAEIRLALTTCDALACLLTKEFPTSKWTDQEVGFAIGRGILVVPVRLGIDPYGFMARHQGYSCLRSDRAALARGLVDVLARHDKTSAPMANGLVAAFEASSSFANAKTTSSNLSLVRKWNPALVARVEHAVESNSQISGSWGVPERVRKLLSTVATKGA